MLLSDTQRTLLKQARKGDIDAWRGLMQEAMPHVAAYLGTRLRRPSVVDELVPEIVHSAWRHLDELEKDEDFYAWLRRRAGGYAMRWYKKNRTESLVVQFPQERCRKNSQLLSAFHRVENAFSSMDEKQRMAVEQWYRGDIQDWNLLADVLHMSVAEAQVTLQKGVDYLVGKFEESSEKMP